MGWRCQQLTDCWSSAAFCRNGFSLLQQLCTAGHGIFNAAKVNSWQVTSDDVLGESWTGVLVLRLQSTSCSDADDLHPADSVPSQSRVPRPALGCSLQVPGHSQTTAQRVHLHMHTDIQTYRQKDSQTDTCNALSNANLSHQKPSIADRPTSASWVLCSSYSSSSSSVVVVPICTRCVVKAHHIQSSDKLQSSWLIVVVVVRVVVVVVAVVVL